VNEEDYGGLCGLCIYDIPCLPSPFLNNESRKMKMSVLQNSENKKVTENSNERNKREL
jgi:hypothetical protein